LIDVLSQVRRTAFGEPDAGRVPSHACSIDFEVIMSFSSWFKVAALALLPLAAIAQQVREADPSDPNAPVPAPGYVSVFKAYRAAADGQTSPDEVWRAANGEVAHRDPHAGHGAGMAGMNDTPAAAGPGASRPGSDAGHSSHHH
jgi:hypothetical protein